MMTIKACPMTKLFKGLDFEYQQDAQMLDLAASEVPDEGQIGDGPK